MQKGKSKKAELSKKMNSVAAPPTDPAASAVHDPEYYDVMQFKLYRYPLVAAKDIASENS